MTDTRCGFIGILGRPNVGKSTLLNKLLGRKLSITSSRAQTTRHRILGIKTTEFCQFIYVDTPGLHQNAKRQLNRRMNKVALNAVHDVDLIVWVLEANKWTAEDAWIAEILRQASCPIIVALNKLDRLGDRSVLLPQIDTVAGELGSRTVVPISALKGEQLAALEREIEQQLPVAEHFLFPADMHTDRPPAFIAAERVREKLTRHLGQELPYAISVEIEKYQEDEDRVEIHALIWVERENQKAIVIGRHGEMLKTIATQARIELEHYMQKKIVLKCWVKAKSGWMNDEKQLKMWGYDSE